MSKKKLKPDLSKANLDALMAVREVLSVVTEIAAGFNRERLQVMAKAMSETALAEDRLKDLEKEFGEDCSFGYEWMMRDLVDRLNRSEFSTHDPDGTGNEPLS